MSDNQDIKMAMDRSVKLVTLSPSRGQSVYRNVAKVTAGTLCEIKEKNYTLMADVPKSMGGGSGLPSPGVMMRSAITGCIAIGIKIWAAREKVQLETIEVTLEANCDARGQFGVDDTIAPGIEGVRINISVESAADETRVEDIINKSLKFSPLLDEFCNPQSVDVKLNIQATATQELYKEEAHG